MQYSRDHLIAHVYTRPQLDTHTHAYVRAHGPRFLEAGCGAQLSRELPGLGEGSLARCSRGPPPGPGSQDATAQGGPKRGLCPRCEM